MIRQYNAADRTMLCDFFASIIEKHKDYISHGELQMGIATDENTLAPNYKEIWLEYLDRQISSGVSILVYEQDSKIEGFIMFGVDNDGGKDYGVIFDMGVNEQLRGRNIGSSLIQQAISSFKDAGLDSVYLESGVNNHSAHAFFESFGFSHVSNIFRAKI